MSTDISPEILARVKSATCAIGALKNETSSLDLASDFEIHGTGVLVRRDVVFTNRHVIETFADATPERVAVWFPETIGHGRRHRIIWGLKSLTLRFSEPPKPLYGGTMDFGFLRLPKPLDDNGCTEHPPIAFAPLTELRSGREIGMCGYLRGTDLINLTRLDPRLTFLKIGPLLYRGHIAAIAPQERDTEPRQYTTILTNIANGEGFSGSPVFLPESGLCVGLHFGGLKQHALGMALPVDQERINGLLKTVDEWPAGGSVVRLTPMGDRSPHAPT